MIEISKGNSKTGPAFSLPEGITCPGKTASCAANCYVKFGRMSLPVARDKRTRNLKAVTELLKNDAGIDGRIKLGRALDNAIKYSGIATLRIHDSRDFFSDDYIRAWVIACSRNPAFEFWSYTRSFTTPNLLPGLRELARLDNVAIWLSADIDNWVSALATFKENPEFTGIAFMETESSNDIARIIQKSVPKGQFINFPVHKAFGRLDVEVDSKLKNCPAITHEIPADKNNPACLKCRLCLPA